MIRLRDSRRRVRARGFSLLEAMIALTILGSSAVALLAWVQQGRDTLVRVSAAREEAQLQLNARAWMRTVNPAQQRQGRADLEDMSLTWTSELAAPERLENDYNGNLQPRWRIGLYRVHVVAQRGDTRAQWDQLTAGWRERGAEGPLGAAP